MRLLLLAVCLLAAACTNAPAPTPPPPPTTAAPQRPREVRLEGVDPCGLLSAGQRAELGLDGKPLRSNPYSPLFRGAVPTCAISGLEGQPVAVGLGLVTSSGIERWGEGDLEADVRRVAVSDFPAVVVAPRRLTDSCSVEVDVAAGQLLDVQYGDGGGRPPIPQTELCRRAQHLAEVTMGTLLAR